jgi:hypothetical protein
VAVMSDVTAVCCVVVTDSFTGWDGCVTAVCCIGATDSFSGCDE